MLGTSQRNLAKDLMGERLNISSSGIIGFAPWDVARGGWVGIRYGLGNGMSNATINPTPVGL